MTAIAFSTCISDPDIAFPINVDAMGPIDEAGTKAAHQFASGIKQQHRVQIVAADTGILSAPLSQPYMLTVGRWIHRTC